MNTKPFPLLCMLLVLLLASSGIAQETETTTEEEKLPKYQDMEVPSVKQLLLEPPVDWIRLKVSDDVIVVEPVIPRPNTLAKMQKEIEDLRKTRPAGQIELDAWRDKLNKLNYLYVVVPGGGESPEFRIETSKIQEVIHHEELLLRRVDLLIQAGEQRQAFELLYQLERRLPEWPGIEDRKNYLIFMEGEQNRQKKNPEAALAFFEQLYERKPDYPELKTRLGEVTDTLLTSATAAEDYRKARHFLGRLKKIDKTHDIAKKWDAELIKRANDVWLLAEAATKERKHGEASLLAGRAISIAPDAPGLRANFIKAWKRYQVLNVGVNQLPQAKTEFFLPTAADDRERHLTETTLFAVSQYRGTPRYHSPYFEQWEPKDLGRRAEFQLAPGRFSWEARPETTATDIVNTFHQLLDPQHPLYDERIASYLDALTVLSPLQLEMQFSHVPLRTEALLNVPLRRTEFDAKSYPGPKELADIFSERFRPVEREAALATYQRAIPEDDANTEFHVAEIQEHKYDSQLDAIQDLLRGKIDMIAGARIWHVEALIRSNQFFVLKQAVPRIHVLQFNPQSVPLRNRDFRRALEHAIDKQRLLHEDILQGADPKYARLVTAPFDKTNYGYNGLIEPRPYDLTLAFALRLASQKALGGEIPTLNLVCDPDPPIVSAARKMIDEWKRVGINVRLVNGTGQQLDRDAKEWDIAYRTVTMPEPLTELWPFLTLRGSARIADLEHLPDWLRQELIRLDTANDWRSAIDQLRRLHRLLWAEVQLIPLWEVDEFSVYRKHIEGYRIDGVHAYQNIDRWTVEPWIPPEAPSIPSQAP